MNFVSGVFDWTRSNTTYPNIKAALNEDKGQAPLLVRETDPNLAVHQQTVVEVDNALLDAVRPSIDLCILLAFSVSQAMQTEQISILSLHNMLFRGVSEQGTKVDKIRGVSDGCRDGCIYRSGLVCC